MTVMMVKYHQYLDKHDNIAIVDMNQHKHIKNCDDSMVCVLLDIDTHRIVIYYSYSVHVLTGRHK